MKKMEMNNTTGMVTIPAEKYQSLLEGYTEKSMQYDKLKETFNAEYNFAEEKVKEIEELKQELLVFAKFIGSKKLSAEFEVFRKAEEKKSNDDVRKGDDVKDEG